MWAARMGHGAVVALLVESKASVDHEACGRTPLGEAAAWGCEDGASALRRAKAAVDGTPGQHTLIVNEVSRH